jgi:transcriptional regulator
VAGKAFQKLTTKDTKAAKCGACVIAAEIVAASGEEKQNTLVKGRRPVGFQDVIRFFLLETKMTNERKDVQQGTLALMVLKTLDVLGSQHGYGIARRIEQISGELLAVNQGTLYPVLLKLEQEGAIASEWGASENNRRARFYRITRAGRKQLEAETRDWEQTISIVKLFFQLKPEDIR